MKKNIILFVPLLFICLTVFGQNDYYWSSNKKNYLVLDSTTILIKTIEPIKLPFKNSNIQSLSGLKIETKYIKAKSFIEKT